MHEAKLHEDNCFITLTYNDENLPDIGSLDYGHFQKFMKKLRNRYRTEVLVNGKRKRKKRLYYYKNIRFFMCGEYGELKDRPHFHVLLFGHNFEDRVFFKKTTAGNTLYTSRILDELWGMGFCTIGELSFESAQYVARYIFKKAPGGSMESQKLNHVDQETGEILQKEAEFTHMSLKPGIGHGFLRKYYTDMFPNDLCVINGLELRPPKYYMRKLKDLDPVTFDEIQQKRQLNGLQYQKDRTPERLAVKEECIKARISQRKRNVET